MSSTPAPYDRQASFTSFQTPDAPTVGQDLEAEFNEIELALDETQARLAEIQRDDGRLANESVHPDSLSKAVRAILASRNGLIRGDWVAATQYAIGDVVGNAGITYLAAFTHVSTADFNVDLVNGRWLQISGGTGGGGGPIAIGDVTGLTTALAGKASTTATYLTTGSEVGLPNSSRLLGRAGDITLTVTSGTAELSLPSVGVAPGTYSNATITVDSRGRVTSAASGGGGGGGEVNTASNIGVGAGIFSSKVGVDLQFRSLFAGSNVAISADGSTVTISAPGPVLSASSLLGRGDSGSGLQQQITIGSGLQMIGTTLSAIPGGGIALNDLSDVDLGLLPGSGPIHAVLAEDRTLPGTWFRLQLNSYDLADFNLYVDVDDNFENFEGKVPSYDRATNKWTTKFPNPVWTEHSGSTLTLAPIHRFKAIQLTNTSGCTVTVPSDDLVPQWPVNDAVWFYIDNASGGALSFATAGSATIESPGGVISFSTRRAIIKLVKRAANTWVIDSVSSGGGAVTSVNGQTGIVTLTSNNIDHSNGGGSASRTTQAKLRDTASLLDWGAVGDNVTNNATAIAAAEASSYANIYVPEGTFYFNASQQTLTKNYSGPGRFRDTSSSWAPGNMTWMTSRPVSGSGLDIEYYFSGDNSRVNTEYFLLGASGNNLRLGLTERYNESVTTPHFAVFQNFSGWSGTSCRLTVQANAGATSVTVNSADGLAIGQTIGFNDANDNITDTRTITNIAGNVVTLNSALSNTYVIGSRVTRGTRTMNPYYYTQMVHRGGGDAYIHKARVEVAYTPVAGQDHIFFTATGGMFGGDLVASTSGVFLTAQEFQCNDLGNDVGAVGAIYNFNRANATGARGAFWSGILLKSEGSQAMDNGIGLIGKFKVGLDMAQANADFGANKCAIGLKSQDRIYFNNSSTPMGEYSLIGNVIGNSHLSWTGSAFQFVSGGTTALTFDAINATFSNNVRVPTGGRFVVNGSTNTAYIDHDSVNDRMRFFTQSTERMRMGAGGVLVNGAFFVTGATRLEQVTTLVAPGGTSSGVILSNWATTTGAGSIQNGGGQALPANAALYIPFNIDGTNYWVPAYTRA